jgi:hypothetical protein
MRRQWHLEVGVATAFVLIFMGASVAEVVLVAGITGVFIQSFSVRDDTTYSFSAQAATVSARSATAEHLATVGSGDGARATNNLTADHTIGFAYRHQGRAPPARRQAERGHPAKDKEQQKLLRASAISSLGDTAIRLALSRKICRCLRLLMVFLSRFRTFGGFVMIPQIETDVVDVHHWLTHQAFADGAVCSQTARPRPHYGHFHRLQGCRMDRCRSPRLEPFSRHS